VKPSRLDFKSGSKWVFFGKGIPMADFLHVLTQKVIRAAERVHCRFGRYFPREIYKDALFREIQEEGFHVTKNLTYVDWYDDVEVQHTIDLVVANTIVVEVRSTQQILPESCYLARLRNNLRLGGYGIGLLLSFGGSGLNMVQLLVFTVEERASEERDQLKTILAMTWEDVPMDEEQLLSTGRQILPERTDRGP
jgi:GxxExxY protein